MEKQMPLVRNERLNLYFIAIVPETDLRDQVKTVKEEMRTRFGSRHALKLPAHITLQAPFKLKEEQEPDLVRSLYSFAKGQNLFDVVLDGFGSFPPRVIFIKVNNHQPVVRLHKEMVEAIDTVLNDGEKKKNPIHPHVTIASRDLKKEKFADAWAEFENREFKASFPVKSFVLLKHNGKNWDLYREFFFDVNLV